MKLSGAELKSKAPAGWRTPRRFANFGGSTSRRQLLEFGSLLPLLARPCATDHLT